MSEGIDLHGVVAVTIIALALGMDAFSMSVGLGTRMFSLPRILQIGITIGIAHALMPLAGILLGKVVSEHIGYIAASFGGLLLMIFGLHMLYNALFREHEQHTVSLSKTGLVVFAFSVSIDSFAVGLSMGLVAVQVGLVITLFSAVAFSCTVVGLLCGRTIGAWVGHYGEVVGGLLLFVFGFYIFA